MLRKLQGRLSKAVFGAVTAAAFVAGAQAVGAGPAAANDVSIQAACISQANLKPFNTRASTTNSLSATYTTTVNCVDINYRTFSTSGATPQGRVRVCFVGAGYCQSSWKTMPWGGPIVVASNVSDGTTYRLEIDWTGGYGTTFETGMYA